MTVIKRNKAKQNNKMIVQLKYSWTVIALFWIDCSFLSRYFAESTQVLASN